MHFCAFARDLQSDYSVVPRQIAFMDDEITDDELLADLFADVAMDALARIGSDANARYHYFRSFIELSHRMVEHSSGKVQ